MKFDAERLTKKSIRNIMPYVPGKPVEEVQRELGLKGVVKLASNENPLGPSKKAVRAMIKKAGNVNYYPESSCFYLRRALAKKLKVKPDNLMFGNGSNELEQIIAEAFVSPGDSVMFSQLSFVVYPIVANIAGGRIIEVPHKDFKHDINGFIKKLNKKVKLIFLCNPNNPTGSIITEKELRKFMRAVSPSTIVALDEAYFEYASGKDYPDGIKFLGKYKNLIVLRTFSKAYGLAGLRVGYGVADPSVVKVVEKVRPPFNVNAAAQAAAEAALSDREHVKRSIKLNASGKKYFYREFKKLEIEYIPSSANYIFVKFREPSADVFNKLLKQGIIIRPGAGPYARITIGTMKQNRKLIKELKTICKK